MFKQSVLMGILAVIFVTLSASEVLAWTYSFINYNPCCSYDSDGIITGAKGPSVVAGVLVEMLQSVEQGHLAGFCVNPQGKLNPIGQAFKINAAAFTPVGAGDCDKKGKCSVKNHQVNTVLDLPSVCSDSTPCPAVCANGDNAEVCLGKILGVDPEALCNNNFSFFGVVWDQVHLTFNIIDPLSSSNPVATLNVDCTSSDGLVFPQQSPFSCAVPKK